MELPSCDSCGESFPTEMLDERDLCPNCRAPNDEWEMVVAHEAYEAKHAEGLVEADAEQCPRCNRWVTGLVEVKDRGGGARSVCEECAQEALESDPSFWDWYWHR